MLGSIPGTALRRLADHLPGAGAVLHQGGVGGGRLGARLCQSVRSAAQQTLSDAAVAGEILRRADGARRAQARAASVSGAHGDRLASLSRPRALRALRLLHGFRLRGAREVLRAVHHRFRRPRQPASAKSESASYVFRRRDQRRRDAPRACTISTPTSAAHFQQARAVVLSANGAETARLLLNSTSNRFPQGLANSSGLVGKYLMFNQGSGAQAVFEHELNEYKSVQVTRILHDFYDSDPKRGFYGGGGIDARINPQPALWALDSRRRSAAMGRATSRLGSRRFRAPWPPPGTARRCRWSPTASASTRR